ncbi:hypothetical protein HELRODRAFT_66900 [Helobdella robusta]|uniref:RRM domain-containing protein n=1 Tax=Helobdella robusta TaxID=6412 RepID=T1FYS7_HELRO|nr:hypothetical protein HELRODRAFT_66900 [Helobdella robusta]ESN98974.1 hypothetical protein HELRODRAFT_66900 [Helobdella robusta]
MSNNSHTAILDLFNATRSMSPPDSDTSGVSTGSEISEAALPGNGNMSPTIDLLKALGLQSDIPMQRQVGHGMQQQPLYNDFSMSADLFASRPWTSLNTLFSTSATDPYSIERAAKLYRNAATISEPTCTWSGQLPMKIYRNPVYSFKVFLGGVPWDITEAGLQSCFRSFGALKIEWPGKDGKHPRYPIKGKELPVGYVYILFESERSVRSLLQACTHDFSNGGEYYFKISSKRMRSKEVQVIPWIISDSNYVKSPSQRLEPQKTVFVGALHGMLNAEGLAHILNDLFGNVVYAGIDTDKHKYPIGSGRVTFSSHKSYVKAVTAAFVEIKTAKFTKKIQIDPYLEESQCNVCQKEHGVYFCRDFNCFLYYCRSCWQTYHSSDNTRYHKPLMRNNKSSAKCCPVVELPPV